MKWKELTGEERYRVVELARKATMPLKELCETFGVSRQTLHRAMATADQGASEALEPKAPGRKPKPESDQRVQDLEKEKAALAKDLEHMKKRYEVATTLLEMERMMSRGEPLPGEPGYDSARLGPVATLGKKRKTKKRKRWTP